MKKLDFNTIVNAFQLLRNAKLNEVEDSAKISIVRTLRALKGIVSSYDEFRSDACETLKGENHQKMADLAFRWEQEEKEKKESTLTDEEKASVNKYFANYNKLVNEAVSKEFGKEYDLDIHTLEEPDFCKLLASNDNWSAEQIMLAQDVLCE